MWGFLRKIKSHSQGEEESLPSERLSPKLLSLRERPSILRPPLKEKKDNWRSWVKRTSIQTWSPPQRLTSQVKNSFNEREAFEDLERREQVHKRTPDPKRTNYQVKTFSFKEKETSDGRRRREQAHKTCPWPWRPDF